jgi:hypothetical protein
MKQELIRREIDPNATILSRPGNPNGDCVILRNGKVTYHVSVSGYHIFRTNLPMDVAAFEAHHDTEGRSNRRLLDGDVQDDTMWSDWVHKKVRFCELQYDRIMARYAARVEELNDFKRKILSMARFGVWFDGHPFFNERGEIRVVRNHSETTINWSYNPNTLVYNWKQTTKMEPAYLFEKEDFVPLYPATWDLLHAIGAIQITDNVDFTFTLLDAPEGFVVNSEHRRPKTNLSLNTLELMVENNWGNENLLFQLNKHIYNKLYGK